MSATVTFLHSLFGPSIDWKQMLLVAMSPVYLIAFVLEYFYTARRGRLEAFRWREIGANISLGLAYQVIEVLTFTGFVGANADWIYRHRAFDIPVNAVTLLPIFFALEFCYYWFHRASHRVRWFWSAHAVHHTGEYMNITTTMRQSLLYSVTGWWLFFMPLVWLGVPPAVVFFLYALDFSYQYFVHTDAVQRLPEWFEYVFGTPANHRVHHGRNPQYIDKNYGGVLMLFDHWFGTFEPKVARANYGIERQIHSYNLLMLNLHEFLEMWRDVFKPDRVVCRN